jgi:hypothetical protein
VNYQTLHNIITTTPPDKFWQPLHAGGVAKFLKCERSERKRKRELERKESKEEERIERIERRERVSLIKCTNLQE